MFQVATGLLIAAAVASIGYQVAAQWDVLRHGPATWYWPLWIAAGLLLDLYWFYQILLWRRIMSMLGSRVDWSVAVRLFFISNLLAYIPGKVANVLGVAAFAHRYRISAVHAGATVVLLQIYSLLSGVLLIAVAWALWPEALQRVFPSGTMPALLVIAGIGLLVVCSPLLDVCVRWLLRCMGRPVVAIGLSPSRHLCNVGQYLGGWVLPGASLWCVVVSFLPQDVVWPPVLGVTAIFIGSYLLGLIAVLMPAGLGVTEAGLIFGLTRYCGTAHAVWGAVVLRGLILLTTILPLCILLLRARVGKTRSSPEQAMLSKEEAI
ncbi:MAG: flippase-like domain-containing protein [Deltaproteobacteria bacterium]|nr:flippase-like domain-containing protein [Deltaproteobacteria bacterium]